MLRDQGSKEEVEERTEMNLMLALREGLQEYCSVFPHHGGASGLCKRPCGFGRLKTSPLPIAS